MSNPMPKLVPQGFEEVRVALAHIDRLVGMGYRNNASGIVDIIKSFSKRPGLFCLFLCSTGESA